MQARIRQAIVRISHNGDSSPPSSSGSSSRPADAQQQQQHQHQHQQHQHQHQHQQHQLHLASLHQPDQTPQATARAAPIPPASSGGSLSYLVSSSSPNYYTSPPSQGLPLDLPGRAAGDEPKPTAPPADKAVALVPSSPSLPLQPDSTGGCQFLPPGDAAIENRTAVDNDVDDDDDDDNDDDNDDSGDHHNQDRDVGSRPAPVLFRRTSQHSNTLPFLSTPVSQQPVSHGTSARRRLTKTRSFSTMMGSVKRSISTPNVQQAAQAIAELPYSTDKRRNKLGYHRTSVACGHCRRRKIRCLIAKDDPRGRCSNCIRLKKDCNFFPVEASDRRPRSLSKPDINSQDAMSTDSSPSPGLGHLPHTDGPRGYPASVPVTPTTYDFSGPFDDGFRTNNISGANGRIAVSRSANVSRKPSLAQMHAMPLAMKVEQGFLNPPCWELPSQNESSPVVESVGGGAELEDPSATFWRLTSSGVPTSTAFIPSQQSLSHMASFSSIDSNDYPEDSAWNSQVSSRMGSIDQGMTPAYSLGTTYSSDVDYSGAPELLSASASTASLTASLSDTSQYGGETGRGPEFYVTGQWSAPHPESPVKAETFHTGTSFYTEDEGSYFFGHTPFHGGAPPVELSHV